MNIQKQNGLCEGAMTAALLGLAVVVAMVLFVMGVMMACKRFGM